MAVQFELKANVKFLVKLNWNDSTIIKTLRDACGDQLPSDTTLRLYIKRARAGEDIVKGVAGSAGSTKSEADETLEVTKKLLQQKNCRIDTATLLKGIVDVINSTNKQPHDSAAKVNDAGKEASCSTVNVKHESQEQQDCAVKVCFTPKGPSCSKAGVKSEPQQMRDSAVKNGAASKRGSGSKQMYVPIVESANGTTTSKANICGASEKHERQDRNHADEASAAHQKAGRSEAKMSSESQLFPVLLSSTCRGMRDVNGIDAEFVLSGLQIPGPVHKILIMDLEESPLMHYRQEGTTERIQFPDDYYVGHYFVGFFDVKPCVLKPEFNDGEHYRYLYVQPISLLGILLNSKLSVVLQNRKSWKTSVDIQIKILNDRKLPFCRQLIYNLRPVEIFVDSAVLYTVEQGSSENRYLQAKTTFDWLCVDPERTITYWKDFWEVFDVPKDHDEPTDPKVAEMERAYLLRLFTDDMGTKQYDGFQCTLLFPTIRKDEAIEMTCQLIKTWQNAKKINKTGAEFKIPYRPRKGIVDDPRKSIKGVVWKRTDGYGSGPGIVFRMPHKVFKPYTLAVGFYDSMLMVAICDVP